MNLNKQFRSEASAEVRRLIVKNQRLLDIVNALYNSSEIIYKEDEVAKLLGITVAKLRVCRNAGKIITLNSGSREFYTTYAIVHFLAYHGKTMIGKHKLNKR